MKADLTRVFKDWFEVAATPVDMAADAVKHYTQGHIQPFVDAAAKSLHKQTETINTNHPGLIHTVTRNLSELKDKIEQAADTTAAYAERTNVPALSVDNIPGYDYLPAADSVPGIQKIKQMTGIDDKKKEKKQKRRGAAAAATRRQRTGGGKRCRRRRKTKKRALKKRHRRRKRESRRRGH